MGSEKLFIVGVDFSSTPSGVHYGDSDDDSSAEAFREEYLKPLLTNHETLRVNLDQNVEFGYGASFLTEAFAKLVTYGYFTAEVLLQKLDIVHHNEDSAFYAGRIKQYINQAVYNSEVYVTTRDLN
jgi:hypothetical protein